MSNEKLRLDIGRHHDMTLIDVLSKLLEGGDFMEGLWRSYQTQSLPESEAHGQNEKERRIYIAGAIGLWFFVDEVITSKQINANQRDKLLSLIRAHMAEAGGDLADLIQASRPNH